MFFKKIDPSMFLFMGFAFAMPFTCQEQDIHLEKPNKFNGLVAFYTFANGGASDQSGNGNDGVVHEATPDEDRFSVPEESFWFDSQDDHIRVSNPSFRANTKGTFAAWVKFANVNHIQYVASAGDEDSQESYISFIRLNPDTKTLGIYQREPGRANWVQGTTPIQPNVYYHVVMMSDGMRWSIYINGKKENLRVVSGTNTGKWIGHLNGIDNFVMGNALILPPYIIPYLHGNIDEVMMFDRVLKVGEIQQLYRKQRSANPGT